MLKNIVLLIAAIFAVVTYAEPVKMPSKSEINAAKDAVEALLESGTTAKEFLEMAEDSEGGAEKYHAYRCAFILQAKDGKYAEAAETLKAFQAEVTGVPASEIVSLVDKNVGKKLKEAKELQAVYSDAKAKVTAEKQIAKIKKEIKKNPKDPILKRSLAEATAISGDWTAALKEFEKAGGEVADIVKVEKKGPTAKIAAFWWDYKPHKNFGATNAFKLHAASLYAGLLEKGGLNKLESSLAEKRVAAAEELGAVIEESAGGDGKPASELAALKKICNTKGLVHCWRFNGNLKDCVGKTDAMANGKVDIKDSYLSLHAKEPNGSNIFLGEDVVPLDAEAFSIEFWASYDSYVSFSRVFEFVNPETKDLFGVLFSAYRENQSGVFISAHKCLNGGWNHQYRDFGYSRSEYHCALVMEKAKDGVWQIEFYQQDAQTGATKNRLSMDFKKEWSLKAMGKTDGYLGISTADRSNASTSASYNEVRIWNRALSEEELTQNAIKFHKAGETMKK